MSSIFSSDLGKFKQVATTYAVSERWRSTLHRVKTYLQSSMTREPVSSCLFVTTYKTK